MKPKPRFKSEREILAEIYQCERDSAAALKEAEGIEAAARELLKHPVTADDGTFKLDEARKLRVRATNLVEVKAKALGQKLAEFRTETLPFLKDKTVQAP